MLGYGQHELLEFLDGIIGNFPADKAAHVEFGDGDRQPFPGASVILSTKAALVRCNAVGETWSPSLPIGAISHKTARNKGIKRKNAPAHPKA